MARCYDKLGKSEARAAYERVIREYADQRAPADEARARLAELSRAAPLGGGATARVVWAGDDVDSQGAPSPDGRYLSHVERETGQLAVRDLTTGKEMRLTEGDGVALSSIIAGDGRQVAFVWLTMDQLAELRIAQIGRPDTRVVYRNPDVNYAALLGWSKDGRHIFAVLNRQDGAAQIFGFSEFPTALWIRWPGGQEQIVPLQKAVWNVNVDFHADPK